MACPTHAKAGSLGSQQCQIVWQLLDRVIFFSCCGSIIGITDWALGRFPGDTFPQSVTRGYHESFSATSSRLKLLVRELDRKFGSCEQDINWFIWYLMKWEAFRPRVHQSVFFPRLTYFLDCSKWECHVFFKHQVLSVFFALSVRTFSASQREK